MIRCKFWHWAFKMKQKNRKSHWGFFLFCVVSACFVIKFTCNQLQITCCCYKIISVSLMVNHKTKRNCRCIKQENNKSNNIAREKSLSSKVYSKMGKQEDFGKPWLLSITKSNAGDLGSQPTDIGRLDRKCQYKPHAA